MTTKPVEQTMSLSDAQYFSVLAAFKNSGRLNDEQVTALNTNEKGDKVGNISMDSSTESVNFNDMITSEMATRFIPKVLTTVVREAVEPNLLVTQNIFETIRLTNGTKAVQVAAVGAMHAGDVGEGREYQERQPDLDSSGSVIGINIKKAGIMIRITEETIEDSNWDVVGIWLRAAGRAMARHKELKAMKLLTKMGTKIFDNDAPQTSIKGTCTGRGEDGAPNGALSLRDLFEMIAALILNGTTPNTLIMHPFAWAVFAMDPVMKEIAGNAGIAGYPTGNPGHNWGQEHGALGLDPTPKYPFQSTYRSSGTNLPISLNVIVSPYVPFDATKQTCSLILCDRFQTGFMVERTPLSTDEFNDPLRDIKAIKMMERYGFAIANQGKGVAVSHNIAIQPTYSFTNVNAQRLSPINQMVPISKQGGGNNPAGAYNN